MRGDYKLQTHSAGAVCLLRFAFLLMIMGLGPLSVYAQVPQIAVTNGTVNLSWPLNAYYYLLQSTNVLQSTPDESWSNSWQNVATASPISSSNSWTLGGGIAALTTNIVDTNIVATPPASDRQFFRLKAPVVPIFSFAIFYDGLLEFTMAGNMVISGAVHANGPIYTGTSASLTINGPVTTSDTITSPTRNGLTPTTLNQGTAFGGQPPYVTNIIAPFKIGLFNPANGTLSYTNFDPRILIDMPTTNDAGTLLGKQREYNRAYILIVVTNQPPVGTNPPTPLVTLTLQTSSSYGTVPGADSAKQIFTYIYTNLISTNYTPARYTNLVFTNYSVASYANSPHGLGNWLSLTNHFTDKREYQTNFFVTQIDVGALATWLSTNEYILAKFSSGGAPTILYVADRRNVGTNKMAAVRLVNGARLPFNYGLGFSLATPNPLYVKGYYNVTADGVHYAYGPGSTTNAGSTVPAALFCDAITILSSFFNDAQSSNSVGTAIYTNTVNAAIITGNVPSTDSSATGFSGGVQNLMRLQEDWSSSPLTLNSSIVVLWASQMATNQFRNPIGFIPAPIDPYYKPPTRLWSFDRNFYDPAKLPPGTPFVTLP